MIKSEKGISLPTLVITVIIMLIISGSIIYTSLDTFKLRQLDDMYNDIKLLNQKVSAYYFENDKLPILGSKILSTKLSHITNKNINDNSNYYIINLDELGGVSLKYGKQYKEFSSDNTKNDVYIINEVSHTIYYLKGLTLDLGTFYGLDESYDKITIPEI